MAPDLVYVSHARMSAPLVTSGTSDHGSRSRLARAAFRWPGISADNAPARPRKAMRHSHPFAGQLAGLPHPVGEPGFVERVVLVDIEITHILLLRWAGRYGA